MRARICVCFPRPLYPRSAGSGSRCVRVHACGCLCACVAVCDDCMSIPHQPATLSVKQFVHPRGMCAHTIRAASTLLTVPCIRVLLSPIVCLPAHYQGCLYSLASLPLLCLYSLDRLAVPCICVCLPVPCICVLLPPYHPFPPPPPHPYPFALARAYPPVASVFPNPSFPRRPPRPSPPFALLGLSSHVPSPLTSLSSSLTRALAQGIPLPRLPSADGDGGRRVDLACCLIHQATHDARAPP